MICLVVTRDRLSHTMRCVAELARHELDIRIVDHGSTWPPMLDWLASCPYPVTARGDLPPRALWDWPGLPDPPYLVTDPDVLLDCPDDWLDRLLAEAREHPEMMKVGVGLRLDDLPDTDLAARVKAWEAPFWSSPLCPRAYRAPVDTTLALYRTRGFALAPAARLAAPYLARHLPWYGESDLAEAAHYRRRLLPGSSHWSGGGG